MSHSLQENLEIVHQSGTDSIHCSQCGFRYCRADQNWREFCKMRLCHRRTRAGSSPFWTATI